MGVFKPLGNIHLHFDISSFFNHDIAQIYGKGCVLERDGIGAVIVCTNSVVSESNFLLRNRLGIEVFTLEFHVMVTTTQHHGHNPNATIG